MSAIDWTKAERKAALSLARSTDALERRARLNPNAPRTGGPCNRCGAVTRARRGKHGEFFGCTLYPRCKGHWHQPM